MDKNLRRLFVLGALMTNGDLAMATAPQEPPAAVAPVSKKEEACAIDGLITFIPKDSGVDLAVRLWNGADENKAEDGQTTTNGGASFRFSGVKEFNAKEVTLAFSCLTPLDATGDESSRTQCVLLAAPPGDAGGDGNYIVADPTHGIAKWSRRDPASLPWKPRVWILVLKPDAAAKLAASNALIQLYLGKDPTAPGVAKLWDLSEQCGMPGSSRVALAKGIQSATKQAGLERHVDPMKWGAIQQYGGLDPFETQAYESLLWSAALEKPEQVEATMRKYLGEDKWTPVKYSATKDVLFCWISNPAPGDLGRVKALGEGMEWMIHEPSLDANLLESLKDIHASAKEASDSKGSGS